MQAAYFCVACYKCSINNLLPEIIDEYCRVEIKNAPFLHCVKG